MKPYLYKDSPRSRPEFASWRLMEGRMKVIAIASQKGGSGKTTLAGHIAVQAERVGAGPVALVDTDPEGSLAEWWNVRQAETPVFVATGIARLAEDLRRLRALGMRLLVIDTPPAMAATISEVGRVSDLVIVPARPSPHDLRAAGATVELVEKLSRPLVFVINGAQQRARITSEAAIALSQHGTLAPSIIHNRTGFAATMIAADPLRPQQRLFGGGWQLALQESP